MTPASMWCPATRGECDRPCVGAECIALREPVVTHSGPVVVTPDHDTQAMRARIAELERERDEARAKLERIREATKSPSDIGFPGLAIEVLRILNEGDV